MLARVDREAVLFEIVLFVSAHLRVFALDFANRCNDLVVAERFHTEVEAHLVVAHARATVRNGQRADLRCSGKHRLDDQIAIRYEQRILALVALARPDERLDEARPDRGASVHTDVTRGTQLERARLDSRAFPRINPAAVREHGMHRVAAFAQPRNAEAGVEATGEGQDDVLVGNRGWGFGIRESRLR